jgi:peptidylprolyl isomerase
MSKADYIENNRQWLADKSREAGVMPLDKGIYYKVINKGRGSATPNPSSVVTVHYTGRTINGRQFDSSRGGTPVAFRLRDLIQGWIIALQQMKVGERREIYLPAEMGYGRRSQPGIPGGSTLIFDIELLGIN